MNKRQKMKQLNIVSRTFASLLVCVACSLAPSTALAFEEFFVPFPEDSTLAFLQGISSDGLCPASTPQGGSGGVDTVPTPLNPVDTVTDFVVRVNGSIIVVDHFEDGYEVSSLSDIADGLVLPANASTRIYGDGDLTNGAVPGVNTSAGDVLTVGQVVVFEESINTTTQLGDIEIAGASITGGGTRTQDGLDGGDRIFASETINITRAQWATGPETLFAGAFELFPLAQWGTSFTLPVGENSNLIEFEWTGITVMAANDATSVSIDANADGDFTDPGDVNGQVINRGQTIEILGRNDLGSQTTGGLSQGARIFSSDIVQANIISGQECSNYASRWFTLFPDALLGNNYYEPVSTRVADATAIYLYNPSTNPITVNWETSAGIQTPIQIAPMSVFPQTIPAGTGARFFTGTTATFGALTVTDRGGIANDWGHASTSQRLMGNIVQVGFAEGDDPSRDDLIDDGNGTGPDTGGIGENGSPVWLIADNIIDTSDTQFEICVDVRGDGGPNTDPNTGRTYDYTFTLNRLDSARLYDGGRDTPNNVAAHLDGDQSGMLAFVCDGSDAILAAAWGQAPDTASGATPAIDLGTTVRSVSADVAFIGDTIFEDPNNNGVRDPGEAGIENVTVILTPPPSVNLGFGPGQPLVTQTDFNGSYLFSSLVNGDYTIEVIAPSGFVQTFDPDASNGAPLVLDNQSNPTITNSSGRLDQDFGYSNTVPSGQVGDFIYQDANGNGIQEPGELGIAGVQVELCEIDTSLAAIASDDFNAIAYNNNAAQWLTAWTEIGDDGAPGTATDEGFGFGAVDGLTNFGGGELLLRGNSNIAAGPSLTRSFDASGFATVQVAIDIRAINGAGLYEPEDQLFVQISTDAGVSFNTIGTIFASNFGAAGNAIFSFDSFGSADVRLRLQVNGANIGGADAEALFINNIDISGTAAPICSIETTDASGNYLFTGQPAGVYTVTVLNPPAGVNSDDPNGDGNNANTFTLNSNGGNLEQDFGYFIPATIIGHVYLDTNGNGVQDLGEPNVANLDVEVTDSLGNLQIVTTDANGDYSADVPPGVTQVNLDDSDPDFPTDFIQTDGVDPNTVTAIAGATVDAGDDGYFQGNVIGDTVYSEVDGTPGIQGAGDPGIVNVLVTLTPPAGVDLGAGVGVAISQTTDANGNYSFVGLPDGDYVVTVAQPSGSAQTQDPDGGNDNTSAVSVAGGVTNNAQDFGYNNNVPQGLIGDRIYTDTNGNGVQDIGELGIAGINVQICGDLDDNNATVNTCRVETTDADGDYLFGDVFAADGTTSDPADTALAATDGVEVYTITVLNPPAGQLNSQDPDGGLANLSQLILAANGGNLDQDFGYFQAGTVTGHLYIDSNGDGVQQAGEPDLVGVDVIVLDANGNLQTVTSDINGDYSAQVPPGTTTVNVDETDAQFPLNHLQTEGTDPTVVVAIAGVNVSAGNDGYAPAGSIGDVIFFDSTTAGTTGVYDPGVDVGIPNVTVSLTPPAGIDLGNGPGVILSTMTDANGNYSFGSLQPGDYVVTVSPPSNVTATFDPNEVGQCVSCDNTSAVTLTAGEANNDQDFGYQSGLPSGRIGDRVFTDSNGNGVQDPGEPGIAGINVQLCGDFDDNDATPQTCRVETTDADGDYLFGDEFLANGTTPNAADTALPGTSGTEDYTLTILNPPTGSTNTADPDGSTANVAQLTLPAGNSNLDQDFGYVVRSSLAGSVWLDEDQDGILDIEETSLTGVQVQLLSGGVVVATTVTDANGDYSFPDILAGDYTVDVVDSTIPAGLRNTFGPNGADPRSVSVDSGEDVSDVDFGYITNADTGAIGDRVWFDANDNGIQDPGEAGIDGLTLSLLDNTGTQVATTTTNANGDYLFTDVVFADDYVVSIAPSAPELTGFTPTVGPQSEGGFVGNPVSLSATNAVTSDIDFGFFAANSNTIVDQFWVDSNGDGVRDTNEVPIENVTVNLYNDQDTDGVPDDADGDGQPDVVATAVSDASGNVTFTGLGDGTYIIGVTDINDELDGFSDTTAEAIAQFSDPVSVAGGTTDTQTSFGYNQAGLIAGTVYSDTNNDNDQNSGELGFADTTVILVRDLDGDGVYETTVAVVQTANDGSYQFTDNEPGDYRVLITSPGGTPTEDPDAATANEVDINLPFGGSSVGNDFGYTGVANVFTMSGTVFIDPDKDGIEDADEAGIPSVTLDLIDRSDILTHNIINGMVDFNDDGQISAADNGSVEGVDLIDGNLDIDGNGTVDENDNGSAGPYDVVAGMINLAQAGTASQSSNIDAVRLASVSNDGNPSGIPGGSALSVTGQSSATEYWQLDLGNVQDLSEITIFNRDDGFRGRLTNVFVLVSDTPFPSDTNVTNDVATARAIADFEFQITEASLSANTDPVVDLAGVSGRYIRLQKSGNNANGSDSNPNHINIAEVKVTPALIAASSDGVVATTTTDSLGNYTFSGLPNGEYSVAVTDNGAQLTGYDITSGLDVLDRAIDNANEVDVDFGYIREEATGSISGEVFIDENSNGGAQDTEFDISNVDVYLCTAPLFDPSETFPDSQLNFERRTGAFATTSGIDAGTLTTAANAKSDSFTLLPSDIGSDNFGYIFRGFINLEESGEYLFRTRSDDGTVLLIDGNLVVDNDAIQAPTTVTSVPTNLEAGYHSIEVRYFELGGGENFSVGFQAPSASTFSIIPASALSSVLGICNPQHPNFVATQTTDANGEYVFTDLPPAQYVIDTDPNDIPSGLDLTVDPAVVSLSEGEDVSNVDVGYEPAANSGILSGFVWTDVDGNGIFDAGEAPIAGVPINVFDTSTATLANPNGTLLFTTTTAADGNWIISNIVAPDLIDGLLITYGQAEVAALGLNEVQPTNLPLGDFEYFRVDLASDDNNNISFLDFGFQPEVTTNLGSIAGTIYRDVDQNGDYVIANDGELNDVTINLVDSSGNVVATTRSDDNGNYSFVGLQDDTYTVVITDANNVTKDLNARETLPVNVVISGGNDVTQVDAGFESSNSGEFSIGDTVFFDANGNGFLDEGETGIPGVTVQCWVDSDLSELPNDASVPSSSVVPQPGVDNLIRTVVTDENGNYLCTSLPEGQYIVTIADANGYSEADDGTTVTGNAGDNFAKNWSYALSLDATQPNFSADFGVAGNNTLSGTVFVENEDLTEPAGNNIAAGELDGVAGGPSPDTAGTNDSQVEGVPVDLLIEQADGSFVVIQSTVTNPDGSYSFDGLPDGRFQVLVRPSGTGIDGYGQTGDPDLTPLAASSGNASDLVCDSPTAALCDNLAATPIDLDSSSLSTTGVDQSGIDFGYQRDFTTTPVTMSFFNATRSGGAVDFIWETSNEVGHAGFQLYARGATGWDLITPELIIGRNDVKTEMQSTRYVYQAQTDAKWFALVDVSNTEEVTPHGPFQVGQEYGANLDTPSAFDWSSIESAPVLELDDVRNLIKQRVQDVESESDVYDDDYNESLFEGDAEPASSAAEGE